MQPLPANPRAVLIALDFHGEQPGLKLRDLTGIWNIYPILHQMEERGLLVSRVEPDVPERGYRPRYWYRITQTGMEALRMPQPTGWRAQLRSWLAFWISGE